MRKPDYFTVAQSAEIENMIQKSRFIGRCFPMQTEEQAVAQLESIRKEQWDARHHCYAYILGERGQIARYSDDGEPSGTAGIPMMEVLKKRALQDVLIVVTRYFGGTLLGAGGLVRAYSGATADACAVAGLIHMRWSVLLSVTMDYSLWGKMQRYLDDREIAIRDTIYTEKVETNIILPWDDRESNMKNITEQTEGAAKMEQREFLYYPWAVCAEKSE